MFISRVDSDSPFEHHRIFLGQSLPATNSRSSKNAYTVRCVIRWIFNDRNQESLIIWVDRWQTFRAGSTNPDRLGLWFATWQAWKSVGFLTDLIADARTKHEKTMIFIHINVSA